MTFSAEAFLLDLESPVVLAIRERPLVHDKPLKRFFKGGDGMGVFDAGPLQRQVLEMRACPDLINNSEIL